MSLDNFNEEDVEYVVEFYQRYLEQEIAELARGFPKDTKSLWVDVDHTVFQYDPDLADDIKSHPDDLRDLFEEALVAYDLPIDIDLSKATVRFHNVESATKKLDAVRKDDVNNLIALTGQISKASAIRPVVKRASWECVRCGLHTEMVANNELTEPHECQGCERQGPFELDPEESTIRDHQLLQVKQPPEEATNSSQMGGKIEAHIEGDDLVGYADAGERADVPGVLRAEVGDDNSPTLDFYFDAHAIDKVDDDYRDLNVDEYRDDIHGVVEENNPFVELAGSIAPGITGGRDVEIETPWGETYDKYWWVRLAAGIANLFGSWRRENGDGTYVRGDSHMIMIGDPSTGKSTIGDAIAEIAPRSASESGKNASGAGLTAAAVKDDFGDGQWSLEAGALVKAHNGVSYIDEIDKMSSQDLDRLHSALERQRLEFNKAGIDATLKCETSMLASGNPDGSRFSDYDTDHSQIDIVESLLDRFDLVFTFKDNPDEEKDRQIARTKLKRQAESALVAKGELEPSEKTAAKPNVEMEVLRSWVALARQEVQPVIKDEAVRQRIEDYYVEIRQENSSGNGDDDGPVPATVRTLDGIMRLAEASARMRLSEEVELIDAEMAIALVKVSLEDIGYNPETGEMDVDWANGRGSYTQKQRMDKIKGLVNELGDEDGKADEENVVETAVGSGMERDKVENAVETLKQKGVVYQPSYDELEVIE